MPTINNFVIPGMVHPYEYNWKKQFGETADDIRRARGIDACYVSVDAGKLMGIATYTAELEQRVGELRGALDTITCVLSPKHHKVVGLDKGDWERTLETAHKVLQIEKREYIRKERTFSS